MDGFESKSWRKEWKPLSRLREYEEEQKVPLAERISERDADLLWQRTATYKADAFCSNCWLAATPKLRALSARRTTRSLRT